MMVAPYGADSKPLQFIQKRLGRLWCDGAVIQLNTAPIAQIKLNYGSTEMLR